MREKTISLYQNAMRNRGWYYTRLYSWKTRLKKYPFFTVWYALADRVWAMVVALKRSPFLSMKTFWGQRLSAPFPDYRSLLHHGVLDARELPLEEYLVTHLKAGDVFFDIGANIGFYSSLAIALGAKAYAFEPTPRTFEILSHNVPTATLVNKALSDTPGTLSFIDLGAEMAGSNSIAQDGTGNISVEAITLDDFCRSQNVFPTYIKMDVEKAELLALTGGRETLLKHHPSILIETNDQRAIDLLLSLGYEAYHFDHHQQGKMLPYRAGHEILSANMLFVPLGSGMR